MQNHLLYKNETKNLKLHHDRLVSIKKKIQDKLKTSFRLTEQRISQLTLLRFKLLLEIERIYKILYAPVPATQEILQIRKTLKDTNEDLKSIQLEKKRIKKLQKTDNTSKLLALGTPSLSFFQGAL